MSKYLYTGSEKYSDSGELLDPYAPEPKFEQKDFTKSAQYIATYLNDIHSVWQPHPGQVAVGHALFYEGKTRVFARLGRKTGKALDLNEIVWSDSGPIKMADIKVGDKIFGEKGELVTVTDVWDVVTDRDVYELEFGNGQTIMACEEHRWSTTTKGARKTKPDGVTPRGSASVKTTKEIAESLMYGDEYNHHIERTKPLNFSKKVTTIDPYLLGVWLGDGGSHGAKVSSIDPEILQAFRDKGYEITHYDKCDYGIKGNFVTELRELGVLKNKHIPKNYLYSDIEDRLSLLQGLLDTDGTICKRKGYVEFYSTIPQIADDVFFLASSLGLKSVMRVKKGMLNGVRHKDCYCVRFQPDGLNVFRLPRKMELVKPQKYSGNHVIERATNLGKRPARCITVDSDTSLYLTSMSCIPTHNTELEIYTLYRWAGTTPGGQFYYVAPFYNQAAEIIWHPGRLKNFLGPYKDKYVAHIYETDRRIVFHNGSFIKLVGSDNYEAGRGFNPDGGVYDEFKDHDIRFHQGFVDNLITKKAPLLVVGTPPDNFDNHFVKMEEDFKVDDRGAYFKLPTYVNPYIDKEELEREKASAIRKGEWAKFMREIMAEIVPGGANSIFPMLEVPRYDEKGDFVGESRHVKSGKRLRELVGRTYRDWEYYQMSDPGSAITMATLFVAIHKEFRTVIVLDEIYETNRMETSVKKIYPRVVKKRDAITTLMPWKKGYDHAAAWFQVEVWNEFEEMLQKCEKDYGEQKKEDSLSVIKDFLLEDMFIISDECKSFISEMSTYATDEKGKIIKAKDHLMDCIRYIFKMARIKTIPKTRIKFDELLDPREKAILEDDSYEFEEDIPTNVYELEDEFLLG